jgi:hypothetical protein
MINELQGTVRVSPERASLCKHGTAALLAA